MTEQIHLSSFSFCFHLFFTMGRNLNVKKNSGNDFPHSKLQLDISRRFLLLTICSPFHFLTISAFTATPLPLLIAFRTSISHDFSRGIIFITDSFFFSLSDKTIVHCMLFTASPLSTICFFHARSPSRNKPCAMTLIISLSQEIISSVRVRKEQLIRSRKRRRLRNKCNRHRNLVLICILQFFPAKFDVYTRKTSS